jgi:hypothetical protein
MQPMAAWAEKLDLAGARGRAFSVVHAAQFGQGGVRLPDQVGEPRQLRKLRDTELHPTFGAFRGLSGPLLLTVDLVPVWAEEFECHGCLMLRETESEVSALRESVDGTTGERASGLRTPVHGLWLSVRARL